MALEEPATTAALCLVARELKQCQLQSFCTLTLTRTRLSYSLERVKIALTRILFSLGAYFYSVSHSTPKDDSFSVGLIVCREANDGLPLQFLSITKGSQTLSKPLNNCSSNWINTFSSALKWLLIYQVTVTNTSWRKRVLQLEAWDAANLKAMAT